MVIFPLAPDQTIAQMWSNGARGGTFCNINETVKSKEDEYYSLLRQDQLSTG